MTLHLIKELPVLVGQLTQQRETLQDSGEIGLGEQDLQIARSPRMAVLVQVDHSFGQPLPNHHDVLVGAGDVFLDRLDALLWSSCYADWVQGETSRAAMTGLTFDTWIDWVFQVRPDARGSAEGGQGFFKAWKRVGSGAWLPVLHITPRVTSAGGYTFDHGIWKRTLREDGTDIGYGVTVGMYMHAQQVVGVGEWQIVVDNYRFGNENCTFADMSPDGGAP